MPPVVAATRLLSFAATSSATPERFGARAESAALGVNQRTSGTPGRITAAAGRCSTSCPAGLASRRRTGSKISPPPEVARLDRMLRQRRQQALLYLSTNGVGTDCVGTGVGLATHACWALALGLQSPSPTEPGHR